MVVQSAGFVAKSLILHSIFLVQKFPAKITIGVKCVTGSVQIAEGIEKLTNHDSNVPLKIHSTKKGSSPFLDYLHIGILPSF